jgi:hypothetical protein
MTVAQLMDSAGVVFGLDPLALVLVLFSIVPTTLSRGNTLLGPPRVGSNSSVMVLHVGVRGFDQSAGGRPPVSHGIPHFPTPAGP